MDSSPLSIQPPDDTGSSTLQRYEYQAHIAFPFCLKCVLSDDILSVIMEHFEDVVLEEEDKWVFIQIKTRDPELRPWRLSHVVEESGGLRSLYRTHRSLTGVSATFALFLEGAVAKDDLLQGLCPPIEDIDEALIDKVSEKLTISQEECNSFLSNVIVNPNQPSREYIADRNIRLLGKAASYATHEQLEATYDTVINEILGAMSRAPLGDLIHQLITYPSSLDLELKQIIDTKRLDNTILATTFGSVLEGPFPLLQRIVEIHSPQPTDLELKLIAAGASNNIISDAKSLRANATRLELEALASTLIQPGRKLEDIRERLIIFSNSISQRYSQEEHPALSIWHEVLNDLRRDPSSFDPNHVFSQDPFLLLGMICVLADECVIDWGVPIA